ncbi:DUF4386 domain-containing protein [Blastococcus sp. SYSU D00820]
MHRRTAAVAGALYFLTHVTAVTAVFLYGPVLTDPEYVLGPGRDGTVLAGALLEVLLALGVVGTAVTLYPVVRAHGAGLAMGYVGLRTLEAGVILVGVCSVLAVVTLRQSGTADATTAAVAEGLVALHDWTFLVGPGLVCGTNTVVLAALVVRSGLVPRWIGRLGLVGGPVVFASNLALASGVYDTSSPLAGLAAVPVFSWEIALATYLVVKGFRPVAAPPAPRPAAELVPA